MPLLLTAQDAADLLQEPTALERLLEAVASAYRAPHPFETGGRNIYEVPLLNGDSVRLFPSVAAEQGILLRVDPVLQQHGREPNSSRVVPFLRAERQLAFDPRR